MDTNALRKFAQAARTLLMDQVSAKLDLVLADGATARREHPAGVKELENAIRKDGRTQVVEQVAYTWFNRFTALRFMDAGGYTQVRVVSPAQGATRPEILSEAMAGNLPDGAPAAVQALLDGRTPSNDPQAEAYRLLLVHACNGWHAHMPFLFEELDDYTELLMPEDLLSQSSILARLREVMTEDACRDVEIIGWLYQFYISEKKDQVFAGLKKNVKITAENIPAATQLFTPHWIVRYLVENSLGRLWLLNRQQSRLAERMDYYIAPEEPESDFLRLNAPEEIRICDPAAGSGHMLTYAFDLLYAIYEEEGYDPATIPALILTHNLTGVEIDARAGALAAFALTMKAYARLGRRRALRMTARPDIRVLTNVRFTEAEMQDVARVVGEDLWTDELRETLGQFEEATNFGSLIVPKLRDPSETLRAVEARDFGPDLLLRSVQERVVTVLRMAEALSPKYHVVVANPPYMSVGGMNAAMKSWAEANYSNSFSDAFSMFIERTGTLNLPSGFSGMVTMQNWMFLSSFELLRDDLLAKRTLRNLCQIGYNSFPEMNSKVAQAAAFVIEKRKNAGRGIFFNLNNAPQSADKRLVYLEKIRTSDFFTPAPENFRNIPGSPLAYWASDGVYHAFGNSQLLTNHASVGKGLDTGDNEKFLRQWFEVGQYDQRWVPCQKALFGNGMVTMML
ncbi:BREX-1 system adenine-specific DNA-methyltransferase PglX [Aestuariicoccus sp. MJ-SS9]|uniref:BREX-1 system adenine-specific DNA-methyltransferase PglX n=1 Tax=Aestuariicoccus sp. MJ-SS9 TaxID=3079855 RepID=UPI0029115B25|nr:BREX-1 system adenine-specific DNA-methyltransferase PglX [Aestuariicoccus sp. MJ-SS9]MDU8911580.1 BREX-1 system adenine-specific DNA-methyltransferase PglX [Aestuariicoccus sp. MJ-SS9]